MNTQEASRGDYGKFDLTGSHIENEIADRAYLSAVGVFHLKPR
jgi:hypothetical protein